MARDKVIVLRLTGEEHEAIAEAAKAHGLAVGPFMRMVALAAVAQEPKKRPKK